VLRKLSKVLADGINSSNISTTGNVLFVKTEVYVHKQEILQKQKSLDTYSLPPNLLLSRTNRCSQSSAVFTSCSQVVWMVLLSGENFFTQPVAVCKIRRQTLVKTNTETKEIHWHVRNLLFTITLPIITTSPSNSFLAVY
jgi:hypothetical protein